MNTTLLTTFVILNIINVIIQTVKSLATVKCGKTVAAIVNAIAYGFYTIVVVYTLCDLPLMWKAGIVALCNLVGVYVVKLCEEKLEWKKSTTYTVLKKLCDRGIFKNEGGRVTSLISKEEYCSIRSQRFVEDTFEGSLPAFIAAFTKHQKISEKEIDALQKMIDSYRKGEN